MVVVIDYGMGNLLSLKYALDRIGLEHKISSDKKDIIEADALILPGVGGFYDAMRQLVESDLVDVIIEEVNKGKLLLGICLGMQLLFERSFEFKETKGFGFINGEVRLLEVDLKVPHMGWNSLHLSFNDPITKYIKEEDYVFYVHSFYAKCDSKYVIASSDYDIPVPGIVKKGNVYGMQFHPEKSGDVGSNLLRAFKEMVE